MNETTASEGSRKARNWYHEIAKTEDGSLPGVRRDNYLANEAMNETKNDQWLAQNGYNNIDIQGRTIAYSTGGCCAALA